MEESAGVRLVDARSAHELGTYPLAPHTRERLISAAHLRAVEAGALPNDGIPLDRAQVRASGETQELEVELAAGERGWRWQVESGVIHDDVELLVAEHVSESVDSPRQVRFELASVEVPVAASGGLVVEPLLPALPALPRVSLTRAGVRALPRCAHPTLYVPRLEAARLLAHARRTPGVEVGALLLGAPFLIDEPVPDRLGVLVNEAVPLADGTEGTAHELHISPGALAGVTADPEAGRGRCGLAHSHLDTNGIAFLSSQDKAFASSLFWLPWQVQIVIDPSQLDPASALAAFAWAGARLMRVCLAIGDAPELPERSNPPALGSDANANGSGASNGGANRNGGVPCP